MTLVYLPHVPDVGMIWMAGCIGSILAVRLLGRASIYLMAPASQAFQLAWTNRTMDLSSGQDGSFRAARVRVIRPRRVSSLARQREECGPRGGSGGHRGRTSLFRRRCARLIRRSGRAGCSRLRHEAHGCQYMLVNGVLTSLSSAVCRLNGLGRRGLDPMLPGAAPRARADLPAIA